MVEEIIVVDAGHEAIPELVPLFDALFSIE